MDIVTITAEKIIFSPLPFLLRYLAIMQNIFLSTLCSVYALIFYILSLKLYMEYYLLSNDNSEWK